MNTTVQKVYRNKNLQILFSVTLMSVMGVTIIAPVLPTIAKELSLTEKSVGYLISVFTLPGIFLAPFLGILSDRIGRKKVLIPSLFIFAIGGGICALSRDFTTLIIFRFIQGVGAAPLAAVNLTIIGDLFKGKDRIEAMGINASVLSVGTGLYPTIGGLVAIFGWYYPFALSLLAIPVGLLVAFSLENPEPKSTEPMMTYLIKSFSLMKKFHILILFYSSTATFVLLYGILIYYFPLFAEKKFTASPIAIGLIISLASFGTIIGSFNAGRFARKLSSGKLIAIAYILYSISLALIPLMPNIYTLVIPTFIYGFANGINIPNIQALISTAAPMEYRGAFMSINAMVLRLGQTLGPVIAGAIFVAGGNFWLFTSGIILSLVSSIIIILTIGNK